MGPRLVLDQSSARMSAPLPPPPNGKPAASLGILLLKPAFACGYSFIAVQNGAAEIVPLGSRINIRLPMGGRASWRRLVCCEGPRTGDDLAQLGKQNSHIGLRVEVAAVGHHRAPCFRRREGD